MSLLFVSMTRIELGIRPTEAEEYTMKSLAVASLFVAITAVGANAGDWTDSFTINGDLRYRHEQFDVEGNEMRNRQRVRARFSFLAEPEANLQIGVRLVSGSDDPVSSNQTMGDGFTTKGIGLDQAYFIWTHAETGAKVSGGKMANPFYLPAKSELMWDSDLSPEGVALKHVFGAGDTRFFVHGAGLWIEERKADDNAGLFGGQVGVEQSFDGVKIAVGGGYVNYTELACPLYDGNFFGNSSADTASFDYDFNLVEFFAVVNFAAGDLPVTVFADMVTNQEADDHERAYMFGAKLGKAKDVGSWEAKYNYREVQADAVMGALTDSDFRGGGTDAKGHEFGAAYQLSGKTKFALSYFINEVGLDAPTDFKRLMVDLKFKF
jgi:hypothetical protein